MTNQIYTINQILAENLLPIKKSRLVNLIRFGEQKKAGTLPEGFNYILAMNTSTSISQKRPRWAVERSEMEAWAKRAKEQRKR